MKTIRLIATFFVVFAGMNNVYAKDISQGTIEIGGDSTLSISSSKSTVKGFSGSEDSDDVSLSLIALYYVAPNVGVGVFWNNEQSKTDDGFNSFKFNANILGPMAGYNMSIGATSSIRFFAGIILLGDYESKSDGTTLSKGDLSGHVLGAELKNFLTESVSVNVGINIATIEDDEDGGNKTETDSTDLTLGLSVYF